MFKKCFLVEYIKDMGLKMHSNDSLFLVRSLVLSSKFFCSSFSVRDLPLSLRFCPLWVEVWFLVPFSLKTSTLLSDSDASHVTQ